MFSDYIIDIKKENCSPEVKLTLLPVGGLYVVTFPYGTQILGTYSNVTEVAAVNETVINVTVVANTEITVRFSSNEQGFLVQAFNNSTSETTTHIIHLECNTSLVTPEVNVAGIIPQYYSYNEIYFTVKFALTIHGWMMHRFSNNVMFLGNSDEMRLLYSKMSKLWVLSETLLELMKDNPLFCCDEIMNTNNHYDSKLDVKLYKKYTSIFNNLFGCLKTTIEYIDKKFKKGLSIQYLKEWCELLDNYDFGNNTNGVTDCIIGDYNDDYNNDYYKRICNYIEPPDPSSLKVFAGTSTLENLSVNQIKLLSDYNAETDHFDRTYNMSAGGYKYFVYPDYYGGATLFSDGSSNIAMFSGYPHYESGFYYYTIIIDGALYRVYRTSYIIGSTLTVTINN